MKTIVEELEHLTSIPALSGMEDRMITEMVNRFREYTDDIHVDRLGNLWTSLNDQRFDVILLDLTIPGSQGLETLTYVQKLAPQVPVVVLVSFFRHPY